jgi:acyl-coenzyme A synthetase/AMP-(fatty) acid ligase
MSVGLPRAVVCVDNPEVYLPRLNNYSIMVVNPDSPESRLKYLLDSSDYSLLITSAGEQYRTGGCYNERLFWYTSGTTGDSKFCSFTQDQVDILARKICQTYDITDNDRYTSIMPLWHAHGQGFYWATRQANCETTFLPVKEIKNLQRHNPTFITAIPDVLKIVTKFKFNNLRFVRSASAPLSTDTYSQLKEKFGVPVIEAFGMTEALSHCFTNPLHGEQREGTVGLPDGVEARIEQGELYIKGPTVFAPDWYNTGDLAQQDEKGYYRILGRSRDQINVRGIKINPASIEQQLVKAVAGIDQCVIFGTDRIKCLYTGVADPDAVNQFLISVGTHCRPKLVNSVDSIPLSPSGKISRSYLDLQFN